MPPAKELSYFAGRNQKNALTFEEYLSFFSKADHQSAIGEASGAYLYSTKAPQLIADTFGKDIKILIVLRNPVEMAYALWGQNKRDGNENLPFDKALEQESRRLHDSEFLRKIKIWPYQYAYFERAVYSPQIKRYIDVFGWDNVKIVIFEKFFNDIENYIIELYEFLGVDTQFSLKKFEKHNEASNVRFTLLYRLHSEEFFFTDAIRKIISASARRSIIGWLYKINSKPSLREPLSTEFRTLLYDKFYPSIIGLEHLLNIDLKSIWK
jgi:hypothetical protein